MNNTIERLKRLNAEGMDFDDAIGLHTDATHIAATYAAFGATPPTFVAEGVRMLDRAIREKLRDEKEAKLANAKMRRAKLATPQEQRAQAEAEIEALERELGYTTAPTSAAPEPVTV